MMNGNKHSTISLTHDEHVLSGTTISSCMPGYDPGRFAPGKRGTCRAMNIFPVLEVPPPVGPDQPMPGVPPGPEIPNPEPSPAPFPDDPATPEPEAPVPPGAPEREIPEQDDLPDERPEPEPQIPPDPTP